MYFMVFIVVVLGYDITIVPPRVSIYESFTSKEACLQKLDLLEKSYQHLNYAWYGDDTDYKFVTGMDIPNNSMLNFHCKKMEEK